tara:strand:- start:8601 stop:9554 length:954 start_codon:yes stop_codon:yes gene_type:complete
MNKHMTPESSEHPVRESKNEVPPALLFEMMRSFTTLARTLNLSHAVKELGSTRQTLRRHIAHLEDLRGAPLFHIVDRHYQLTDEGHRALPDAKELIALATVWLRGQSGTVGQLQILNARVGDWAFFQQQKPIGSLWNDDAILMRETYRAWSMASGQIESPLMAHVRPFLIVYRHTDAGWVCVEFGEKSVYVHWFGLDFARSSIGRPIARLPAGEEFGLLMDRSFHEVESNQSARLDHIFTRMPLRESDRLVPVAYQRLILGGSFPDGSPAILSLIQPLQHVDIAGVTANMIQDAESVPPSDFDPISAIFESIGKEGI